MPHINISLMPILAKIAIFVILVNFDPFLGAKEWRYRKSDGIYPEIAFQELFEYVIRFGKS